jgi:hypothetical protein
MTIALRIFSVLLLIGTGWLARRRGWLTDVGTRELSRVLLSLFAPCLIIASISRRNAADLLAQAHLPLLTFALALLGLGVGILAVRAFAPMPEATRRGFLFQCMINNYLFLPLPIVLFQFGERGVALLLLSALGFDVAVWTLGVGLYVPGRNVRERLRGILSPAVLALALTCGWVLLRDLVPPVTAWAARPPAALRGLFEAAWTACDLIGRATLPVSMLVAGSRITALHPSRLMAPRVVAVAVLRLAVVPALFLFLLQFLPLDPVARGVLGIVALMPTAVTAAVFSDRYGGDTDFVVSGLILTHLLSLITVPLGMAWLLR